MQSHHVDVAIIGAGTAGLAAYRAARAAGQRVLLIEAGKLGTMCARSGCMPSKLLLAAAHGLHDAQALAPRGIQGGKEVRADGRAVMAYVRAERDRFVAGVIDDLHAFPEGTVLRGLARFVSDHVLVVNHSHEVHARSVVIATGAAPSIPTALDVFGDFAITSEAIFEWDTLPQSAAVLGAGPVALELGQALARLGVRVQIFGRNGDAANLTDPVVRDALVLTLQEDIYLDTDAEILEMKMHEGKPAIRYRVLDGDEATSRFDVVIAATGRQPALDHLQLENTTLRLDARGIPEHNPATLQCGMSSIFVAGDCDGTRPWLADASDEGTIAGTNAARYPDIKRYPRKTPMSVVFCEPQAAQVGASFASLDPRRIVIGEVAFANQGRSRIMRRNHGKLRIYADGDTGRVLGAEGCGPDIEHLAHLIAWGVQLELTIDQMIAMPYYHPVVEEGLRSALLHARKQLGARRPLPELLFATTFHA
ncbi:Dihydrolipoyl dehydrogenase [Pararobbsia alpina]|uniref:dihydrolipoyl dehydrogenase n=1 Tax=Pararobbsia alpina TaxID=621374 RepID=UPI0039A51366